MKPPRGLLRCHTGPATPAGWQAAFDELTAGVAATISLDDSESHFHLAVAYREMALFDDAVRELGIALGGAHQHERVDGLRALRSALVAAEN